MTDTIFRIPSDLCTIKDYIYNIPFFINFLELSDFNLSFRFVY